MPLDRLIAPRMPGLRLEGAPVFGTEHFRAIPRTLEHQVECRRDEPDRARRRGQRAKRAAHAVDARARDRRASVPVRDDRPVDLRAQREVELQSRTTEARALPRGTGGKDDAEPRREPHRLFAAADELAAVVDRDVAERATSARGLERQRVAELIALRAGRPFLGEGE